MPDVTYVGSHHAVEIEVDGRIVLVGKDKPVAVDADQAAEMDKSDAWSKVPASKPKARE